MQKLFFVIAQIRHQFHPVAWVLAFFAFLHVYAGQAQTRYLKYTADYPIHRILDDGRTIKTGSYQHVAELWQKDRAFLYRESPGYDISGSQNGFVEVFDNNKQNSVLLPAQSIITMVYQNLDSMIRLVYRLNGGVRQINRFPLIIEQQWEVLPDVKNISGMACQKAVLKEADDIVAEVWFSPETKFPFGLHHFNNMPGLLVEAHIFYPGIMVRLIEYQQHIDLADQDLYPKELHPPHKNMSAADYQRVKDQYRKLRKQHVFMQ